jgi:ribosome biogenesis GTPase / thiamine phosphate phosphatase
MAAQQNMQKVEPPPWVGMIGCGCQACKRVVHRPFATPDQVAGWARGAQTASMTAGKRASAGGVEEGTGDALAALGWRPAFAEAFEAQPAKGLAPARVVAADRLGWTVVGADGEPRHALAAGQLRYRARRGEGLLPVVGDWVGTKDREGKPVIQVVLPRETVFSRRSSRTGEEQVLVANLDYCLVTAALPNDLNPRRLERYLAMAWEGGARPVVVLNKVDLVDDVPAAVAAAEAVAPGVPVHAVSAVTGQGIDELRGYFPPANTVALLGSSGVGKSTLVNLLLGREQQAVGAVRADGKGRHTTTGRELFPVPGGGLIADTPGLRTVLLWESADGVADAFEDIAGLAAECRFADCRHEGEPGCAVVAAVEDGRLPPERLAAYRKLQAELRWVDAEEEPRVRAERRRQARIANKALRAMQKER